MKSLASNISSEFIKLKDDDWLNKQRIAGKVVADTLSLLEKQRRPSAEDAG